VSSVSGSAHNKDDRPIQLPTAVFQHGKQDTKQARVFVDSTKVLFLCV